MIQISLSGRVSLFQGDALGVLTSLPDASVDAVLTDPPYASGGIFLNQKSAEPEKKYLIHGGDKCRFPTFTGDARDQRSWIKWCAWWLFECWRIAKEGSPCLVFTDWRQLPALVDAVQIAGWIYRGIVAWNKTSSRPMLGRFRAQCEYLFFATKGRLEAATRKCLPGVYSYPAPPAAKKLHTTAKPVPLLADLLAVAREDAIVLDPFMGSGSAGEACVNTGRGYVGIELSPEYFQISRERLCAALAARGEAAFDTGAGIGEHGAGGRHERGQSQQAACQAGACRAGQ